MSVNEQEPITKDDDSYNDKHTGSQEQIILIFIVYYEMN